MSARITHVALKDYRSIGSCDVELQPLTLLVGPNGSGKSNFLDALRFLRDSMILPLNQVVASRSGILSLLHWQPGGGMADSFSITIRFELGDRIAGTYTLSLEEGPHSSAVIREELCRVGDDWFSSVGSNIAPVPA
ncbi:MAG: AAA family ATPase [Acidobacteria bacterium]|nr:AAA family ATPase [Acidobacteriota bacterium]